MKGTKYIVEVLVKDGTHGHFAKQALDDRLAEFREWGDAFVTSKETVENCRETFDDMFNRTVD